MFPLKFIPSCTQSLQMKANNVAVYNFPDTSWLNVANNIRASNDPYLYVRVYCVRNVVTHGDAREGKWRGNWRMQWVASTLTRPRNVVYPALLTLMRTPRLPAVDWTDSPADLNRLVRLGERRNVVSALVPSGSAWALHPKVSDGISAWAPTTLTVTSGGVCEFLRSNSYKIA